MAEVVTIVDGATYLLSDIRGAHISGLTWTHGWPYGCLTASWQMTLKPNTSPRALSPGAWVEIWDGPIRVWSGYLSEPVPGDPWTLNAKGWYARFERLLALDDTPAPTAIPADAVTEAIDRAALPVTVGTTLSSTSISAADETVALNYVKPLLDTYVEQLGERWMVDADRVLTVGADPTSPFYVLEKTDPLRGTADDDYVTDVYPRYVESIDVDGNADGYGLGHVSAPSSPAGRSERPMDLTDLMILPGTPLATANGYAQAQLDLNSARMGYTESLTVGFGELLRPGGTPARLAQVRAGRLLRSFNVADASGQVQLGMTADVVIGETTYRDGERTIQIKPIGLAPRTFMDTQRANKPKPTFDGTAA